MQIANDTEDDVSYTVGGPGEPTRLASRCYLMDASMQTGDVIQFFEGKALLASSEPIPGGPLILVLKKSPQGYEVSILLKQDTH